ncbi:LamB/YcsF family protein, partial [Micromonospora humida]|uniref:LamB/YcsF family protein n=1 Tax=Micromonospora humida TaxID=2809018 RepID=UPI0036707FB3
MSLLRAAARRVAAGLVVLWAAATTAYLALLAAPGNTVDSIVGDGADTPQIRAQIITEWGLDRPPVVQYLDYLWRLAGADLGRSYLLQRPVAEVIGEQLAPTATLAVAAARGVAIGAQVSYRDLAGFGRRFIEVPPATLVNELLYQMGALEVFARLA